MATPLRRGGLDARSAPPPSNPGAPAPLSLVLGAQAPIGWVTCHSSTSRNARASSADPRRSAKATTLRTRTARSSATVTTSPSRTVWLGPSTRRPLIRTWPAAASAAAFERVRTTRACQSHLSIRWRSKRQGPSPRLFVARLELFLKRCELREWRIRVGFAAVPVAPAALDVFRAQRRIAIRTVGGRRSAAAIASRRSFHVDLRATPAFCARRTALVPIPVPVTLPTGAIELGIAPPRRGPRAVLCRHTRSGGRRNMGRLRFSLPTTLPRTSLMARLARVLVAAAGSPDLDEFLPCRLHLGRHVGRWRRLRGITGGTLRAARELRRFAGVDQGRHRFWSRGCACDRFAERSRSWFNLRCREGRCLYGSWLGRLKRLVCPRLDLSCHRAFKRRGRRGAVA